MNATKKYKNRIREFRKYKLRKAQEQAGEQRQKEAARPKKIFHKAGGASGWLIPLQSAFEYTKHVP